MVAKHAAQAAGAILLSVNFDRTVAKYGNRGYRYCLLEVGHIAQNFCLVAASLDLAVLCHGAFYDDFANALSAADGITKSGRLRAPIWNTRFGGISIRK